MRHAQKPGEFRGTNMIKTGENDQKRLPANVTGSGVARSKRWLVAYVRMRHEKKTSERLTQMGIENFLPVQEEIHQWSDRRKRVERVRWLVAYVRMRHEKKTSERLTQMGIENFLPVQEEIHQWSDRRKRVERVLMPMMIFVHVDLRQQKEVLTLSSVSRYMVLRGESAPAVIPDEQMNRFKFMLDYSEELISMNSAPLARGENINGATVASEWNAS